MTDIDILKSIAENLSERKSSAALNNYLVLCNNIKYVNDLFDYGVKSLTTIHGQIDNGLKNDRLVNPDFADSTKSLFHFRKIIPRVISNDINVCDKFIAYTKPDDR
jgi:hypothetical protein